MFAGFLCVLCSNLFHNSCCTAGSSGIKRDQNIEEILKIRMTNSLLQIVGDFLNLRCMYQEPVYIATVQNAGSKDYFWASKSVRCLNIFEND